MDIKRIIKLCQQQYKTIFNHKMQVSKNCFTEAQVISLINLHQQLTNIELYMADIAAIECAVLDSRVLDENDILIGYECFAEIDYVLSNTDPGFNHKEYKAYSSRRVNLKNLDHKCRIRSNTSYRVPTKEFYGEHNEYSQSWLYHEFGNKCVMPKDIILSLHDYLRIGSVWIYIKIQYLYSNAANAV